jgi:membrane-bound lytic murein transglycosylase A
MIAAFSNFPRPFFNVVFVCVVSAMLAACASGVPISLTPQKYQDLSGWQNDDHKAALRTFLKSCDALEKRKSDVGCSDLKSSAVTWKNICTAARQADAGDAVAAKQFFETQFMPYRVATPSGDKGLFTGYYIPEVKGSRKRGGKYQTPVYRTPPDIQKGVGYHTRAEIYGGALKHKGLEIAWVDDPVALFFIEIQGSGVIRLAEGGIMTIGFAGKNNREYIALGRIMGDEGMLDKDDVNLFTIKKWLYEHPNQARAVMERNPSYVFFQELKDNLVRGAQGVGLTDERSMAVDWHYYPYGLPMYLQTTLPATKYGAEAPYNRIMIAQDTGGAIRGGIRGDIYFGHGARAETLAGHQAERGALSLLLPPAIVDGIDLEKVMPCQGK